MFTIKNPSRLPWSGLIIIPQNGGGVHVDLGDVYKNLSLTDILTPLKFDMEPENGRLEKQIPFGN